MWVCTVCSDISVPIFKIITVMSAIPTLMHILQSSKIKLGGYTFRGNNSVNFIFGSFLNEGHLLEGRICSPRSKFFPLRVDPNLDEFHHPGKQTGSDSRTPDKKE